MEDKESGSLSEKSALEILLELHRGLVTGSLKLERVPLQKAVYFRDGQILFAASNDPKDQLASILVEEGKLRPEQMEVAQARATPGNPLAKVLTELGYISQRELGEAARTKVEKILTDLYTWKEGTYQFVTKSLPKGALDIELSSGRLLFASIRRVQDRSWILDRLGSLDSVMRPSASYDSFMAEAKPEDAAVETLGLVDGAKTIKQIGAASSLGEFEVCKVLAAALVCGALEQGSPTPRPSEETPSLAEREPSPFVSQLENTPSLGNETVQLETTSLPPSTFEIASSTNAFARAEEADDDEQPVFVDTPKPEPETFPTFQSATPASELLVDKLDEPQETISEHTPRRPRRAGGRTSRDRSATLQWVAALVLVAGAAFSLYYFVWPILGGRAAGTATGSQAATQPTKTAPPPEAGPQTAPPQTETPAGPADSSATPPRPEAGTAGGVSASAAPATSTRASESPPPRSGNRGRDLLASGKISDAGNAFLDELTSSSAGKFTIAVGLYCNEDNVARISSNVGDGDLYVLPTTVEGRRCYRVAWGLFESRETASAAMSSLPNGISAGDAAPIAVARLLR